MASYGFFASHAASGIRILLTAGAGVSLFLPLAGMLALGAKDGGTAVNLKVVSVVFFIVLLVEQLIFGFAAKSAAPYIIVTGILLLIYLLIAYSIAKALE